MDPVQPCVKTPSDPNTKLCISPSCQLSNPYICPECEQAHEHNGTLSAVRIAKVRDLYDNIEGRRKWVREARKQVERIRDTVLGAVEEVLGKLGEGEADGVVGEVEMYLGGNGVGQFGGLWDKVKDKLKELEADPLDKKEQQLKQFKAKLIEAIDPSHKTTTEQAKKEPNLLETQSQFLQHFSNIFTFLNLELKSSLPQPVMSQFSHLHPKSRLTQKLTTKLFQTVDQPEPALALYTKMLKANPLDTEILTRKVLLLVKCKKYQEAYEELTVLADLIDGEKGPGQATVQDSYYRFLRGEVCRILGKYGEAEREFGVCEARGGVAQWKLDKEMGHLKFKQGKYQDAIKYYERALKSSQLSLQTSNEIHENLYQCGQHTKNPNLSIASLSALYKATPSDLEPIFKRARLYHEQKEYKKAIQDYTLALQQVKTIPGLYYNRAVEYVCAGESELAVPDLKKAIEMDSNFKEAASLLAGTCFQLFKKAGKGETAEYWRSLAIKTYHLCLNFFPNNEGLWHNLAILDLGKDNQKSYDCFSKALQINPKLGSAYLGKVKCAIKLQKSRQACLADINTAISLGERGVSTFLIKGALELELGHFEEAGKTCALILQADPDNAEAKEIQRSLAEFLPKTSQSQPSPSGQQGQLKEVEVEQVVNTQLQQPKKQ